MIIKYYQNSVKDVARYKLLSEISDRIRQSLDLKVILKTATQEIRTLLDLDFVGLTSLDKQKVTLKAYSCKAKTKIAPKTTISHDCLCPNSNIYKSYLKGQIRVIEQHDTKSCLKIGQLPNPKTRLIIPILIKNPNYTSGFLTEYTSVLFPSNNNTIVTDKTLYG